MIRFNQSKGNGFEVYEPGTYDFEIVDVKQGTSKNGNPQLTVKTKIVGGRYDGKTHTEWYSLTEASAWKITALVEATGCPHSVVGTDSKGTPIVEFDETDLVGLFLQGDLEINEYNGKKSNRLNKERPSEYGDQQPEEEPAQVAAPTPAPALPRTAASTMAGRRPRTVAQQ